VKFSSRACVNDHKISWKPEKKSFHDISPAYAWLPFPRAAQDAANHSSVAHNEIGKPMTVCLDMSAAAASRSCGVDPSTGMCNAFPGTLPLLQCDVPNRFAYRFSCSPSIFTSGRRAARRKHAVSIFIRQLSSLMPCPQTISPGPSNPNMPSINQ